MSEGAENKAKLPVALPFQCVSGGFCMVPDEFGIVVCYKCGCRLERRALTPVWQDLPRKRFIQK